LVGSDGAHRAAGYIEFLIGNHWTGDRANAACFALQLRADRQRHESAEAQPGVSLVDVEPLDRRGVAELFEILKPDGPAGVMYYHRIMQDTLFEGAYAAIARDAGKVGNPLVPGNPDGLLKSASVFAAADSPFGPAYLGYGPAKGGTSSFYFYLGRPF
jgi:hypothetical protein